jgi:predicted kinase
MTADLLPLLVYVSGKPGSGKSTLARALSDRPALGLPLLSLDAVRRALLEPHHHNERVVDGRTVVDMLYNLVETFLTARLSLIVELSFRRGLDERRLRTFLTQARVVNVHCAVSEAQARARFIERERLLTRSEGEAYSSIVRTMQEGTFDWQEFDPLDLSVPRLYVSTSAFAYSPTLAEIIDFCYDGGPRPPMSM